MKITDKMKPCITHKIPILLVLTFIQIACTKRVEKPVISDGGDQFQNNMLSTITTEDLQDFQWLNPPHSFEVDQGILTIIAEKETDFFNNPEDNKKTATAPLLFKEVKGDFIAKALVSPDFTSLWNAVALMVHIDPDNWIKFAFENSDATGKSIVTVITKNTSDDANGVILNDQTDIWLKMVRKGDSYSMLWSKDGKDFKMARLSTLPSVDSVKVGIEAQSPVGESATHQIDYFEIEHTTVKDLRKGE